MRYVCMCCMYACMYLWMCWMYVCISLMYANTHVSMHVFDVCMHVLDRCGASSRASLTTPLVTSFKSLEKVLLLPVGVVEGGGLVIWDRYVAVSLSVFLLRVSLHCVSLSLSSYDPVCMCSMWCTYTHTHLHTQQLNVLMLVMWRCCM